MHVLQYLYYRDNTYVKKISKSLLIGIKNFSFIPTYGFQKKIFDIRLGT